MEARREGKDAAAKIRTRRFQRAPDGRKVFQFLFLLLSLIYFCLHLIIYTLLPCPITICFIFCLCQGRKGAVRCSTGGGDMRNVKRQSLEIGYLQKQEIQGECHKQKGLIKAITRPGNREPFSFTRHRSGQHPKWLLMTASDFAPYVHFLKPCYLSQMWLASSLISCTWWGWFSMAGTRVPGVRGNLDGKLFRVKVRKVGTWRWRRHIFYRWNPNFTVGWSCHNAMISFLWILWKRF